MLRPALLIAAVSLVSTSAVASDAKHKAKAKKPKHESARQIRESMKVSMHHHFKADNMPRGWQWPPTQAMATQEKTCEAKLDQLGVTWKAGSKEGHVVDPIVVDGMQLGGVAFSGTWSKDAPQTMDCELALAFANLAPALAEAGVHEVKFGSIYRWTKVRAFGKTQDVLSRHALGLAMDVVSFVDADGGEHVVGRDYKTGDELLLAVEHAVNESGLFRLLLTPKNDPQSHKDHFHFEANPDFTPLAAPAPAPADESLPPDPDRVDI